MKSVAIVGFASATREQVYQSNANEVWSLNMLHSSPNMRRVFPLDVDRLFEIHPIWMLKKDWYTIDNDHWGWLTRIKHHYPIYLIDEHPEIYNGVKYPLNDVVDAFLKRIRRGNERVKYFTSSLCYMIPLALLEGFSRIEIYGFEMGSDTEYVYQKAGAEFWIGIASQHVDIKLAEGSLLCRSKLYGFDGGQLIPPETVDEWHGHYLLQQDELLTGDLDVNRWIQLQLTRGAVKLCEEIQAKGDAISRQVLESYKNIFDSKTKKLSNEINVLNSRALERIRFHNGDRDVAEPLAEDAFTVWEYMYRYDGAYQLALKFISLCDLQDTGYELKNRFRWHGYSETKPAGSAIDENGVGI